MYDCLCMIFINISVVIDFARLKNLLNKILSYRNKKNYFSTAFFLDCHGGYRILYVSVFPNHIILDFYRKESGIMAYLIVQLSKTLKEPFSIRNRLNALGKAT